MTRRGPAVVLVALAVATLGAFFVAQRLKSAPPPRELFTAFSPNGDGRRDEVVVTARLDAPARVDATVIDAEGERVRTVGRGLSVGPAGRPLRWNGATDRGPRAAEGLYRVQLVLPAEGRAVIVPRLLALDVTPPRAEFVRVRPREIVPGRPGSRGRARVRFRGATSTVAPALTVFRLDRDRPREVARVPGAVRRRAIDWRPRRGSPSAAPGLYGFVVEVTDRAGNRGRSSPPRALTRGAPVPPTVVSVR